MGQTPCEASQTHALSPPSSTGRAPSLHVHCPGLQGQHCLLTWDTGTGHLTPYLTLPHPPPRAELSDQRKDARISLTCHHQTPRWSEGGRRRGPGVCQQPQPARPSFSRGTHALLQIPTPMFPWGFYYQQPLKNTSLGPGHLMFIHPPHPLAEHWLAGGAG